MKLCSTLFLLFIYNLSAQQKPIETIYFDFDKYILSDQQTKVITDFVKNNNQQTAIKLFILTLLQ